MRWWLCVLLLWCSVGYVYAQFYSTGRGNPLTKLDQIKTDNYQLIFPKTYAPSAQRLGAFLDSVRPYISIGIGVPVRSLPIILHTKSVYSNGYVTWAPRREELVMMPPASTYAMTWSRQLAIHEWRHVNQITALNHGLTRVASWLLGEAGYALGLMVMSKWQLEGDATLAETQLSEFGRALQPDFTVGYRSLFDSGVNRFRYLDPWVCGSYRVPYPDIYHYGYQVMSAAETYLGKDNWGEILKYSGTWPIFIFPDGVWLKRKYKTSYHKIAKRAFGELDSLWRPLAVVNENFVQKTNENKRTYTKYQWPMSTTDFGLVAWKEDWDKPARFVAIDTLGNQKVLKYIGSLSSRAIAQGNNIYWTEFAPHPIYEQESFSVIRSLDLSSRKLRSMERDERNFFITPMGEPGGFACVALDDQLNAYIQLFDSNFRKTEAFKVGEDEISLHGLAWDSTSGKLAFIALENCGMWIGTLDETGAIDRITEPSVVTVSDLTAKGGRIYFSSIQSGKNEIHTIDLDSHEEHRLTDSKFGSTSPILLGDSVVFVTTRAMGQMLAAIPSTNDSTKSVLWSRLPLNLVNAERYRWQVPKANTIEIPQNISPQKKTKRFSRVGHSLNVHSWAPVSFDADFLTGDRDLQLAFGATAFLQSTMSDLEGFATYGYVNRSNWVKGSFRYLGLPLAISFGAEYGGGSQLVYGFPTSYDLDPYFSANLTLSLPLNLTSGSSSRLLQPTFSVQHSNALLLSRDGQAFTKGLARYEGSLWWSSTRRISFRSVVPRLGYALRINVSGGFDDRFSTLYSVWARGYLPGLGANHSITVKVAAQYQKMSILNFQSKVLTPRGYRDPYVTKTYSAMALDYTAPLAYPDWGWDGVVFLKRIWASAFGDVSRGDYLTPTMYGESNLKRRMGYSYGLNIGFDITLIRTFPQSFSITLAMPKNQKLFFGFNYSFSIH